MAKNNSVQSELTELMEFCQRLFIGHRSIDYFATTVGIGLVVVFGVLGNGGTLLTLSGRRLTTATFVYYRAIALTDLIRCIFVISYVLRVVVPFRRFYEATWYEAHVMYFVINTLSFVSASLAVTLCVRLCIGILQSRRLKKTKTNPKTTKMFIYFIVTMAIIVNCFLCFEYEAVNRVDYCVQNRTVDLNEYMIQETNFHSKYIVLVTAIHLCPIIILLTLICGAGSILTCGLLSLPKSGKAPPRPPTPRTSSNALLIQHCPSVRQSRPWRTQRQLCKLFLLLSLCYALGLLPEFLNLVVFSKIDSCNCTSNSENYRARIRQHFDRENFAAVSNIFQNIGHALSFYVYVFCSDAFRAEFLVKLRRLKSNVFASIWPYSRALGCTTIGAWLSEKTSQSSDYTKGPLRSVTLLAELDSEECVAETFAPEQILAHDDAAMEMLQMETTLAAAAVSYTNAPVFTLANAVRRMSTHFHNGIHEMIRKNDTKPFFLSGDASFDERKEEPTMFTPSPTSRDNGAPDQSLSATTDHTVEILSPVQLQPHRYQRFYSSDKKRRASVNY